MGLSDRTSAALVQAAIDSLDHDALFDAKMYVCRLIRSGAGLSNSIASEELLSPVELANLADREYLYNQAKLSLLRGQFQVAKLYVEALVILSRSN